VPATAGRNDHPTIPPLAFYCVADAPYFLGAVGTINSLRVVGHTEPVYLLDCGLTGEQRGMLAPHVSLVQAPPSAPPLLKTVAPLSHPAEVMVLLDADIIVTRRLTPLIDDAARGRVVAFRNHRDRFVAEWEQLPGLGPMRRQPYLCSGLVAMARDPGDEILATMRKLSERVRIDLTHFDRHVDDYPLLYADQDVLNAILASRIERDRIVGLDHRLAPMPPFEGVAVKDEHALRCVLEDGRDAFAIHHSLLPKPWQRPAYDGVYSRLLRRLLAGPDAPITPPRRDVPLGLREGAIASLERGRVKASQQLRWRFGREDRGLVAR
jgi:hypothetical protein